jgi:ubiquinone/menaquinone biosynthesis C-methylase UbiE
MSTFVPQADASSDIWAEWILHRRHGGDEVRASYLAGVVGNFRDRVLDGAALRPGMTLLDVGAGDGVVAFGAIERAGPGLHAILADISPALLEHAERLATERGIRAQCSFIHTAADTLVGIDDASVDLVTTRSVLAYVADKAAAARAIYRVLKPGGRISLAEPIYRDDAVQLAALTSLLAAQTPTPEIERIRLMQRCRAQILPSSMDEVERNPLTNFTERKLIQVFQEAGFPELHLELHIDVQKVPANSWETFIRSSPRPGAPTLHEVLDTQFTPAEAIQVETMMRPSVEAGRFISRELMAYLTAEKPRTF